MLAIGLIVNSRFTSFITFDNVKCAKEFLQDIKDKMDRKDLENVSINTETEFVYYTNRNKFEHRICEIDYKDFTAGNYQY